MHCLQLFVERLVLDVRLFDLWSALKWLFRLTSLSLAFLTPVLPPSSFFVILLAGLSGNKASIPETSFLLALKPFLSPIADLSSAQLSPDG